MLPPVALVLFIVLVLAAGCGGPERTPDSPPRETATVPEDPRAPRCTACRATIERRYIELDGKKYHPDCYERVGPHCGVCQKSVQGSYVTLGDGLDYHPRCWETTPRCEGCGLAAGGLRGPAARWRDGRVTCTVCKAEAVVELADARRVLADARALVKEHLGLDLGKIETPIELVGKPQLIAAAEELGQPAIKALTVVREEGPGQDGVRGARTYKILALFGLPRPALVGILGHELFHVVQSEATPDERDAAFREGAANYVQVTLLRARGEHTRARLLERDTDPTYGEGLRRFERLVKAKGQQDALRIGIRSIAFPPGF